jgi:hypothetical protein
MTERLATSRQAEPAGVLYHVSEQPGLTRFEPRPQGTGPALVWAIEKSRLHNYLLPRDCPRVTFYARDTTIAADRERFLGEARNVVAIEKAWAERAAATTLSVYSLPAATFSLHDGVAGYYTSTTAVLALEEQRLPSALSALAACDVEVRLLDCLWGLREAVAGSSLGFSIIRFRNASPAPTGFRSRYPVPG